ncbi:aldose 1-epimerase [Chitinophaga sp. CF118]|uniref:aldose 1-epimerase n=1 Tax=Chitinophaga sp. CF118 TaxID=1884367 RepID=UPI0008E7B01F|nr:aldose 1-epimerase [Chitinophaga sp. CF118]SFE13147.1 aldose 1-epimerase [Chitinophaga sp. CF118]
MFSIDIFHQAGFEIIALTDNKSGTQVEIIPACGALLHAFRVPQDGGLLNIIDSYSSLQDYQNNLSEYFRSAKLSPFACRIPDGKYEWQQKEYTIEKSVSPGKVIHGLLYDVPFNVTAQVADKNSAVLTMYHEYNGDDAGYPFPYLCEVQYSLLRGSQLNITTIIRNLSGTAIPLMDGWHPYFSTGTPVDEMELQFASTQIVEFNAQLVPTGKLLPNNKFSKLTSLSDELLDNSFMLDFTKGAPLCLLRDPKKQVDITFYPGTCYPVLQIYIPPHRDSIAIENLTGAPNAFNNGIGLLTVPAGESREFSTTLIAAAW